MKRQRGRNRKPGGGPASNTNPNRSWDSQGPENIKVRGNAQTVYERYMQLARDAQSAGDRVLAENYLQHAEHYFRVVRALQPHRPAAEIAQREMTSQGFDIDFEDESGAQAAAILAAHQAEQERLAREEERRREREQREQSGERREWRDRDQPREPREPREGDESRADGEGGERQGGRRESRRERWERRRDERNRRFDGEREGGPAEGSAIDQPSLRGSAPEPEPVGSADERRPRRDEDEAPAALPGFLTRPVEPAPVQAATEPAVEDAPAPRRRAPRRRAEAAPVADEA